MKERRNQVEEILKRAGELLLTYWPGAGDRPLQSEQKSDGSLVTEADLASNKLIGDALTELFPEYNIKSEEEDISHVSDEAPLWLFDPLDGTTMFSKGKEDFAILLACIHGGTVQSGYMYFPVHQRMIQAHQGESSLEDKTELSINSERDFDKPNSIYIRGGEEGTDPRIINHRRDSQVAIYQLLHGEINAIALNMEKLGDWDIAAPALVLEQAGAIVTDENNEPLTFSNTLTQKACKHFVASAHADIHKVALSVLPQLDS